MEIILFMGIQATGKSTFYQEYFSNTHIRINLDMLKTRHREKIILNACLEAKQRLVVDNTNPTVASRERYITPAKASEFKIIGYYFQSKLKDAIRRNSGRMGKSCIPEKGILATYSHLQIPQFEEGFDSLYYVTMNSDNTFTIKEWLK